MGFFNILETFFFISLAITFVLIMMLVYHFKGRIAVLEDKCDTMFEIMNNIVKEMRTIKTATSVVNPSMMVPNNEAFLFGQPNLGEIFKCFQQQQFSGNYTGEEDEEDEDEDEEDEDDRQYSKIIVSDTEIDEDMPVKIINIDLDNDNSNESMGDLVELEEETFDIDESNEDKIDDSIDESADDEHLDTVNYKKMDISYLRTMVITRGLATDTKKLKKNDLIKLLEESQE